MLLSLALAFLCAMILGWVMQRLHLPALLGMLLTGVLLGPYAANLLDASILGISSQLRQIALIIVLTRAGLGMDFGALKRVGRPAVLLCFVPACFEIAGTVLLAPVLLGLSVVESAVLGAVIAAVSPAVVVPKMLRLMEEGYGTKKSIPQLILAGASVDDVFVIVLFSSFTGLAKGESFSPWRFAEIPISILLGVLLGAALGLALAFFFQKVHVRDSVKVLLLLSFSFLLVALEDALEGIVPISGLIAVMSLGIALQRKRDIVARRLSLKFSKLWVALRLCRRTSRGHSHFRRAVVPYGRRVGLPFQNKAPFQRTAVLRACLYAESDCAGGNRFCPAFYGPFLREYRPHRRRARHFNYRTARRVSYRSNL